MLTSKKEGDSIYIVFRVSTIPSRSEIVKTVGRLFITTVQGNKFCRKTGAERRSNKRREFIVTCKAWPSKEVYRLAVAHYVDCRKTLRDLSEVNPGFISEEELTTLKTILKTAKAHKHANVSESSPSNPRNWY